MENQPQSYTKKQIDFINKKNQAAARMAARTEKEIHSLSTNDEINLVKETWSGGEPSNVMSFKDRLMDQIVGVFPEEVLATKWNINKEKLLQKIMDLTEHQVFTLIRVSIQQRSS